jgi:1,4-alpha-glucan branching enzyme
MQPMTSTTTKIEAKSQKFSLLTRTARSVQLVGDFTHWEEHPIPLRREPNGVWHTAIKLEPGTHHYRFLVDGLWYDDPECPIKMPNPFGGMNSVRQVS